MPDHGQRGDRRRGVGQRRERRRRGGRHRVHLRADDLVTVCADYTSDHGSGTVCNSHSGPFPPRVVYDTVNDALTQVWAIVDPPVCAALTPLRPGVGPVHITSEGDVYVNGEPTWDCPPYGME